MTWKWELKQTIKTILIILSSSFINSKHKNSHKKRLYYDHYITHHLLKCEIQNNLWEFTTRRHKLIFQKAILYSKTSLNVSYKFLGYKINLTRNTYFRLKTSQLNIRQNFKRTDCICQTKSRVKTIYLITTL